MTATQCTTILTDLEHLLLQRWLEIVAEETLKSGDPSRKTNKESVCARSLTCVLTRVWTHRHGECEAVSCQAQAKNQPDM